MFEKIKNFKLRKKEKISDEEASFEIAKNYKVAEEIIKDRDKLEDFLNRLENKLRKFPKLGKELANIPILILLIKSYCKREYTVIPVKSLISIVSALVYFLAPIDLILDAIPTFGLIDDVAVLTFCIKAFQEDIDKYIEWKKSKDKKNMLE